MWVFIFLIISITSLLSLIVRSQAPSPHNIAGQVFTNSSNGVQNGIPIMINNTVATTGDTAFFILIFIIRLKKKAFYTFSIVIVL